MTATAHFSGSQGGFLWVGIEKSARHFNLVLFPYLSEINPAIPFTNKYFGFNLWCTI